VLASPSANDDEQAAVSPVAYEACCSTLKDLIATFRDGESGFARATRDSREPGIDDMLRDGEAWCRSAALELQEQVQRLGAAAEASTSATASPFRGWISPRAVPIFRDTKLILEECERGLDYTQGRYKAAMDVEFPEPARQIVACQYQRLIALQGRVRLLRNRYPATALPQAIGYRSDSRR
jgi:uncharacterized protein (TIGR02284 family)